MERKLKYTRKFKIITGVLVVVLIINAIGFVIFNKAMNIRPVKSPSIFVANVLESSLRTPVENLLFISVISEELKNSSLKQQEVDYLNHTKQLHEKLLDKSFKELSSYYSASEQNRQALEAVAKSKAAKTPNNETKALELLLESVKKGTAVQPMANISKRDSSYVFYKEYLNEYCRLIKWFKAPAIPKLEAGGVDGFELGDKVICLTFDDGPTEYTGEVLETLKEKEVPASFFIIGKNLYDKDGKENKAMFELVQKEKDMGHAIGVHTMSHTDISKIKEDEALAYEIVKGRQILKEKLNYDAVLFRPPFGSINNRAAELVMKDYKHHVLWNIDSQDWRTNFTKDTVKERVIRLAHLYNGGIILSHDRLGKTGEILPELIDSLQASGFKFSKLTDVY